MKHFLLKFNHGVEIGAELAYRGHYERTKDDEIRKIADEEVQHRETLKYILNLHGQKSSKVIDSCFTIMGWFIRLSCKVFPIWSLDFVARSMETFAIFNYMTLMKHYPLFEHTFAEMAGAETRHEYYFGLDSYGRKYYPEVMKALEEYRNETSKV